MSRKRAPDQWLFLAVITMTLFGVLMVYSASSFWALEHRGSSFYYLYRQAAWALLGLGAMVLAMATDYRRYRSPYWVYGILAGCVLLQLAALASPPMNGARRWIWIGPFSLQPSEPAKLALVLFLAYQLDRLREQIHDLTQALLPCGLLAGPLVLLVLLQRDLGAAAMMVLLFGVLFFVAGLRLKVVMALGTAGLLLLTLVVLTEEYRLARVMTFLDPDADPQGAGFQMNQSLLAVASGGVGGRSLGESRQKLLYLPLPHTDFIYAVIGEEWGMLGCLAVVAAFGVVGWRGLRAALLAQDPFGAYLGIGITVFLVGQALVNIGVVLGLLPTKGLPLPLISYGGSSLVVSLAAAGVLLNLSEHSS